ncbi:MAG: DUF4278 domain-containing protein [Thermostichales cyanobacterium BF4_bins_65]
MKLYYRGIAHEYNPFGVAAIPQGGAKQYRGLDWRFPATAKVNKTLCLPATASLRFRGVPVKAPAAAAPAGVASASATAPLLATERELMAHHRWGVRNRHQVMLARVLSKMGLSPRHSVVREQSIHHQGNWAEYERAHASLS